MQSPLTSFWKYGEKHSSQKPVRIWQNWQSAKQALELDKRFKNEKYPNIAVTVDLLTNAAFLAGSPLTLVGDRSLLVVASGVVLKGAFAVSQLVKHIDCYNLCRKNLRQLSTSQCTCRH